MTAPEERAATEAKSLISWWREYRQLVSVPEWYAPLEEKIAESLATHARRLEEYRAEHEKCIEQIQADQLKVAERENELHEEKDRRLEEARAIVAEQAATCRWDWDTFVGMLLARLSPRPPRGNTNRRPSSC